MKSLKQYISEKLVIKKNKTPDYKYFPKTKLELEGIIRKRIKEEGNNVDLNDIDTSKITDMSDLFEYLEFFNGNISRWDVSNVTNMRYMFYDCQDFNQDISGWDVSNVTNMSWMFAGCQSFNQDISSWDISDVKDFSSIFGGCYIDEKYKPKFK